MRPLESMRRRMEALGLFSHAEGTLLDADLKACAVTLDIVYDALVALSRESFLATAESWGLAEKGVALGLGDAGACLRGAALYQLWAARQDRPFTVTDLQKAAAAAGLSQLQIYEMPQEGIVFLDVENQPADADWTARFLRRFLPAHLKGMLDMRTGARWEALDAQEKTWESIDAENQTWADRETHDTILF